MSVFDGFKPFAEKRKINSVVNFREDSMLLSEYLAVRFTYRTADEWQQEIADGRFLIDNIRVTEDIAVFRNKNICPRCMKELKGL